MGLSKHVWLHLRHKLRRCLLRRLRRLRRECAGRRCPLEPRRDNGPSLCIHDKAFHLSDVPGLRLGDVVGTVEVDVLGDNADLWHALQVGIVLVFVYAAYATHLVLVAAELLLLDLDGVDIALEVAGVTITTEELGLVIVALLVKSPCCTLAFPVAFALGRCSCECRLLRLASLLGGAISHNVPGAVAPKALARVLALHALLASLPAHVVQLLVLLGPVLVYILSHDSARNQFCHSTSCFLFVSGSW